MENQGREIHVTDTEASAGSKEGVVRWVLIIGTLLAVVVLSLIWIGGAMTQGDIEEEATATGIAASQESGEGTDSIVSDRVPEAGEVGDSADVDTPLATVENETE